MKKGMIFVVILMLASSISSWAQLTIKKQNTGTTLMQVTSDGKVGIAIGSTTPAATLDVGGDLRLGTVADEGNTTDISVLVLDGDIVKKRTLTADIWDGDATGSGADGVVTSATFSGTSTKTLTLGRSNGLSDLTASFTDRYAANTDNQNLSYTNLNAPTGHYTTHRVDISGGTNATIRDYYDPNSDSQTLYNVLGQNNDANGRNAVDFGALSIGSNSTNSKALYVNGTGQITGTTETGNLHVHGTSIRFDGNSTYDPAVGRMELTTEFSGGSYGSQKLVFTAASAQEPPDNYKITVDVDGTDRIQETGFLCRAGGENLGQLYGSENGNMTLSNLVPGSASRDHYVRYMFRSADGLFYPEKFRLYGNGDAEKASGPGDWAGLSDIRVKDQIETFEDGLDILMQLEPKQFVYNGKGNTVVGQDAVGFIAQDIQSIVPYAVDTRMAKLNSADTQDTELLTLDTTPFTYIAINSIQELTQRVRELEAEIARLKNEQ